MIESTFPRGTGLVGTAPGCPSAGSPAAVPLPTLSKRDTTAQANTKAMRAPSFPSVRERVGTSRALDFAPLDFDPLEKIALTLHNRTHQTQQPQVTLKIHAALRNPRPPSPSMTSLVKCFLVDTRHWLHRRTLL